MSTTFAIEMLPAREGDCLLLSWGDSAHPHRLLVDGGRAGTLDAIRRRFDGVPAEQRVLELLVVTHVDRDHIEGVLPLLAKPDAPVGFRDVWFNGYHHLHDRGIETFGPAQGERLSELLRRPDAVWNGAFGGRSVESAHAPEPIRLAGGLTLRVLAPGRADLERLIPVWERECRRAGVTLTEDEMEPERDAPPGYEAFGALDVPTLAATPFVPDPSTTNASSIVLLAEFEGRTALLTADAHAPALVAALGPLAEASASGRFALDALKVPHHGSSHNVSNELVALLDCTTFLLSTNGSYHGHPHDAALARVLTGAPGAHMVFNYRSARTEGWDDDDLRDRYGYTTSYPASTSDGTNVIDLLAGPRPRAETPTKSSVRWL